MKLSTKAALMSCFVFPGVGHLYLKRFIPGLILFCGSAAAVWIIASSAVDAAFEVVEVIQSSGVPLNAQDIAALVSQKARISEESTNGVLIAWLVLWLIGIFDSYRVGRALDKSRLGSEEKKVSHEG